MNARLRLEVRRREITESLQTSAELSALRAQLNPHFLFNTLNSIVALAGPSQPRTMEAISHLASMLRYTLCRDMEGEDVSLRQELAFTDQYLMLESLRLGERLQVIRDIAPEALVCRLPPLTLQPLVENEIRHGIAPRANQGTLILRAYLTASSLHLEVQDDGVGGELAAISGAKGLGMRMVRQRLELLCDGQTTFVVQTSPGQGCKISISFPLETKEASDVSLQEPAQVVL